MPIDLSNVNVTIQQFQKIASGKYNAGEIRLTGRNSLGKVNNHVTMTGQNVTPLSLSPPMQLPHAMLLLEQELLAEARAKFVTKNPAATYGSLTPQERNKANFAMAIASQGSHIAVASGFGVLLDPNGRSQSVGFGVSASERSFEMEIDHEGGLNVHFRFKIDVGPTVVANLQ